MKSGPKPHGFTIVETLIVLAVTSAILISAFALVSGSQNKTEFNQAINDINQTINSTLNNVANGYYNNNYTNYTCKATPTAAKPTFTSGTVEMGANQGCIFVGRTIQFTNDENFYIHNIVGKQQTGATAKEVSTMTEAAPQIIDTADGTINVDYPNTTESKKLKNGIIAKRMAFKDNTNIWKEVMAGIAFTSSLGQAADTNVQNLQSGASAINISPTVFRSALGVGASANTKQKFIADFDNDFASQFDLRADYRNPASGIIICFDSGSTNQRGIITIGGSNRQNATDLIIQEGKCDAYNFPS